MYYMHDFHREYSGNPLFRTPLGRAILSILIKGSVLISGVVKLYTLSLYVARTVHSVLQIKGDVLISVVSGSL